MPLSYQDAFSLADNPFYPRRAKLLGVQDPIVMQTLVSRPLRVHEEASLLKLYSEEAGPFKEHVVKFLSTVSGFGYDPDNADLGSEPFIFLIKGSIGSGKTTLANVMVHHLKRANPKGDLLVVFDPWAEERFDIHTKQEAEIEKLEKRILDQLSKGKYCCVLIDNLVAGAEERAFQLYARLIKTNLTFLFLISGDADIRGKSYINTQYKIYPFDTKELTPETAINFVRHRIHLYRSEEQFRLPELAKYNVFPFAEENIKRAVEARKLGATITIRTLSVILDGCLSYRIEQLSTKQPGFRIQTVAEPNVAEHIIDVATTYQKLLQEGWLPA
jgi:hypothetical protein